MNSHSISQKSAFLIQSIFVTLFLAMCFALPSVNAQSCTTLFPSGAAAPGGYGASWNVFSTAKELLLNGTCSGDTVNVSIGSDQPNQYIFNNSFYWNGSQWRQLSLTGANPPTGSWLARQGKASFAKGTQDPAIFVGYVCQFTNNAWKCGCADNACTTPHWQVQAVQTAQSGGGGGIDVSTDKLEPPPPMTKNPITFTNVCPGEGGWPSASQMAGRDVKIVLPKDRVCKERANIGGTNGSPAHNIWLSGGEINYTGGSGGTAGLTIARWDGTAYIEGIMIDVNNSENDGIRTDVAVGSNARVVVQNSYIRGMGYGTVAHGDIFHAQGGGTNQSELVMRNVRGDLLNQGVFVPFRTNGHGVRRLVLDHVEFRLDSRFKYSGNKISTMIFAGSSGQNGDSPPPNGQVYNEVYLNWWDPWYPSTTGRTDITNPKPSSFDGKGCAVFAGGTVSANTITGSWCKGSPPGGTFVPLDKIGRNYDRSFFTNK